MVSAEVRQAAVLQKTPADPSQSPGISGFTFQTRLSRTDQQPDNHDREPVHENGLVQVLQKS